MRGTRTSISRVAAIILICVAGRAAAGVYSGGAGTEGDPYLVSTAADLQELMGTWADWGMHFVLTKDIEFPPGQTFVSWNTIGNSVTQFSGTFDGAGFCIRGLTTTGYRYRGLFGWILASARIINLGVESSLITAGRDSGLLVGLNDGGTITNCYATGSVFVSDPILEVVGALGGLVGENDGGTITDCYATGSVFVSGTAVQVVSDLGALVGYNSNGGTITNCYATGSVFVSGPAVDVVGDLGGLVGENNGGTITNCYATGSVFVSGSAVDVVSDLGGLVGYNGNGGTITNCYATVLVSGIAQMEIYMLGGLAGTNDGMITNCYATGYISARASSFFSHIGGLVGYNYYDGTITDCYATGYVSASASTFGAIGGLVGYNRGTIPSTSFWNTTTSGMWASDGGTGIAGWEMRMLSTFTDAPASWDFTTTWQMQDGLTFPYLHIGIGAQPPVKGDLDGDGDVDFDDFQIMANNWLAGT